MDIFLQALRLVFDPYVLTVIFFSSLFGLFVGAIPGLTATMATALLVPVTFFMPPVPAVAAIAGIGGMKKVSGTSSAVAIVAVSPGTAPTNRPKSEAASITRMV